MGRRLRSIVVRSASKTSPKDLQNAQSVIVIDETIGSLIAVTSRLMDRTLNTRLRPFGVSFGQWPLLMNLWAEEGLSQRELSRRIFIEEGTTARTLDRMEAEGLIVRKKDSKDRRQQTVYLTKKGRNLRDVLVPTALANNDHATQSLTKEELQALPRILRKMISAMMGGPD